LLSQTVFLRKTKKETNIFVPNVYQSALDDPLGD